MSKMKVFVTGATGFIGGSIAVGLVARGHAVRGLVRDPKKVDALRALGIEPVLGELSDQALLTAEARAADAVINAASSDNAGAVTALVEGLAGSNKPFIHTSGSSIVGDASGGEGTDRIYDEDHIPEPTADKVARVAIDRAVVAAKERGVRSVVLCNTLIYGNGRGVGRDSVQLPRLVSQARKSGVVRHVGPGRNIWSNVHIDDVVDLYLRALDRLAASGDAAGTFHFVENGEASFADMAQAIAAAGGFAGPEAWTIDEAKGEWGYEMASYALGSNSRVRALRVRTTFDWSPRHDSVLRWIADEIRR